ncbi:MAG: deiodinase-like protein [Acidobacteriota bacterium]
MRHLPRLVILLLGAGLVGGCFPHHQADPRLPHFAEQAPALGEPAPEVDLVDLDGEPFRLADRLGERPLVLRLGSHSCPVYRYRRFSVESLVEDYRDAVDFLVIYTLEAHPSGFKSPFAEGEWNPRINRWLGVHVPQTTDLDQRIARARASHADLGLLEEMVVDTLDDAAWRAYGSAASPAFVFDRHGRVVLRQTWIDPGPIRETLDRLLAAPTSDSGG